MKADSQEKNLYWRGSSAYFRKRINKRDHWQSLGELAAKDARRVAKALRQKTNMAELEDQLGLAAKRTDLATCKDLFTAYDAYCAGIDIDAGTAKSNKNRFRLIIRTIHGADFDVDEAHVSIFDVPLLKAYSTKMISDRKLEAAALGVDKEARDSMLASAERTVHSNIQQARSLYASTALQSAAYAELVLPNVAELMKLSLGETTQTRYRGLGADVRGTIAQNLPILKTNDPKAWLAVNLAVNMGMRRGSAVACKWNWFKEVGVDLEGMKWFAVDVVVAKGNDSEVRIDADLYQEIHAMGNGSEFVLGTAPALTAAEILAAGDKTAALQRKRDIAARTAIIERAITWLRTCGLNRRMPFHELRKWYLSSKVQHHGLTEGQFAGGHGDSRLTAAVYSSRRSTKSLRVI